MDAKKKTSVFPFISVLILVISILCTQLTTIFDIPLNLIYYYNYKQINEIIDFYVKNPTGDITLTTPIYFDSEYKFPDLAETIDINVRSRMKNDFFLMLNYNFDLLPGSKHDYFQNKYPDDTMFIYAQLSDANAIQIDGARNYGELYFNLLGVDSNDLPFFLTQLLVDVCFGREINKYAPDSFYKFTDDNSPTGSDNYFLIHADAMEHKVIEKLINRNNFEPLTINLNFHIVAADLLHLNMSDSINKLTIPLFESFNEYFKFNVNCIDHKYNSNDDLEEMVEIDGSFPKELTDIPVLKDIYTSTISRVTESNEYDVNFVYYPYFQGGEKIKSKVVDGNEIYSDNENMYLKIGDWGSVYFAHTPSDLNSTITFRQLEDCVWSFNEALLDILGVPNESTSPEIRMNIFKRYLSLQNIINYSTFLFRLRKKINMNDISCILQNDPVETKRLLELFNTTLEIRKQVVEMLGSGNTEEALSLSGVLVKSFNIM